MGRPYLENLAKGIKGRLRRELFGLIIIISREEGRGKKLEGLLD